jgi:hypothetical protein
VVICTRDSLKERLNKIEHELLAHGRWFYPGTPASSTTKTGRHDIAEILLKVGLNTKNQSINQSTNLILLKWRSCLVNTLKTVSIPHLL